MSLKHYEEDESEMFLMALHLGIIHFIDDQMVDLGTDYDRHGVKVWCEEQWPDNHVISCCMTFRKEVFLGKSTIKSNLYEYAYRFFFKTVEEAAIFKLTYSHDLVDYGPDFEPIFLS